MKTLREVVLDTIKKGATVSTDESHSYCSLAGEGHQHRAVKNGAKERAFRTPETGKTHHTSNVESF